MHRPLKTILLPLALASMAVGCGAFSDSVATVGDQELSPDELDQLLEGAGVAEGDLVGTRAVISDWIVTTAESESAGGAVGEISDADVDALYNQGIEASGITCPALVATADPAASADVAARLQAGESFGTVFAEVNVAPDLAASGGFVGCFPAGAFPAEVVEQADVAALFAVNVDNAAAAFELEGEQLVVAFRGLDEIDPATATEARNFIREQLVSTAAFDGADVEVDSRFGYFDPQSRAVLPLG